MQFVESALPVLPIKSPLHGNGLQANRYWNLGDLVFSEIPRFAQQTLENRKLVFTCGYCFSFLGNAQNQMEFLQGTLSRATVSCKELYCTPCRYNCGEFYCDTACRDSHWLQGCHQALCTGIIDDADADSSPLIAFKIHAVQTNEIFLLVADVFTAVIAETTRILSMHPFLSPSDACSLGQRPLEQYVRQLWWDAAMAPRTSDPISFTETLKALVSPTHEEIVSFRQQLSMTRTEGGADLDLAGGCAGSAAEAPQRRAKR
jgi:hypothetical protein